MANSLLSLLAWSFLPGLVTSWVQAILYGMLFRAGDPKPQPGTARHAADRRRIQLAVVAIYLVYTIIEADWEVCRASPNFYAELGVGPDASDRDVKSRFRRLAALHHPDKAGQHAAAYFIHLKAASDTLLDATRRFAYDRFGPDVLEWRNRTSIRDFVFVGVFQGVLPHYGVAAAAVYGMGWLGYLTFGRYERWVMMLAMFVLELGLATRPRAPVPLGWVNAALRAVWPAHPPLLQFQAVALGRRLAITAYIALSQMGPLLRSSGGGGAGRRGSAAAAAGGSGGDETPEESLGRLDGIAAALGAETTRLWDMEMAPYAGDPAALASLRDQMAEWLVQNTIRTDPMVRDSLESSFKRRRTMGGAEERVRGQ